MSQKEKRLAYSLKEASEATSLSRRSLEYLILEGRLAAIKIKRRVIIPARDLEKLVETGVAATAKEA
jgi:excisionase family DNA binding protein